MNILLLGSGGRENALAWKIKQSPKVNKLYIAPGNAGTASIGINIALSASDFDGIRQFVLDNNINMVVVGPEDPLVKGIYDYFKNDSELNKIPVIGPSKEGARLEGSKDIISPPPAMQVSRPSSMTKHALFSTHWKLRTY